MKEALLYATTFIIEDNLMWFVPVRYNYLCCYNLTTEVVEKKFRLPEGNYYPRMYDNILSHEGKLYLIPLNGGNVFVFDRETEQFQKISIEPYNTKEYKFYAAIIYQNTLYLFPERVSIKNETPSIVVSVDLIKKENVQVNLLNVSVASAEKTYYEVFDRRYYVDDYKVYILLQRTNKVIEYNLECNRSKIYDIGSIKNQFVMMYKDQDIFYFVDFEGCVTVWDKTSNQISKYKNEYFTCVANEGDMYDVCNTIFKCGDSIYFCLRNTKSFMRFIDGVITKSTLLDEVLESDLNHIKVKNNLLIGFECQKRFFQINLYEQKLLETIFSDNEVEQLYTDFSIANLYRENDACYGGIHFYLKKIEKQFNKKNMYVIDNNIGMKILGEVMK